MQNDFELVYSPKEVYQRLKIADSTFRKWAIALEAEGYEFRKEESGNRIFTKKDIEVFEVLQQRLDAGQSMKNATSSTMAQVQAAIASTRTVPVPVSDTPVSERSLDAFRESFEERFSILLQERVQTAIQPLQNEIAELKQMVSALVNQNQELKSMLPAPKDPNTDRQERMNEYLTIRRITLALETEALAEWNKKPESERMRKTGLFRKMEEDLQKRDRFIKEYSDRHFEQRLSQEFA